MAGRGPQTFKKRQKEQQRKEKQAEKLQKRQMRKQNKEAGLEPTEDSDLESNLDVDGEPVADSGPSEDLQTA